jgi:site-specific recombinase XerD
VTKDEAHDHFKRTVADSKWQALPGYRVLRHSFISALASEGVDQRVIDEVVGHQSEEQRKRYRHLYPGVIKEAIQRVFG